MILRKHTLLIATLLILSLSSTPAHAYSKRNVIRYIRDTILLLSAITTGLTTHTLYTKLDNKNLYYAKYVQIASLSITSAITGFTGIKNIYNTYRNSKAQHLAIGQDSAQDDTEECPEMSPENSQSLADNMSTTSDSETRYRYE